MVLEEARGSLIERESFESRPSVRYESHLASSKESFARNTTTLDRNLMIGPAGFERLGDKVVNGISYTGACAFESLRLYFYYASIIDAVFN